MTKLLAIVLFAALCGCSRRYVPNYCFNTEDQSMCISPNAPIRYDGARHRAELVTSAGWVATWWEIPPADRERFEKWMRAREGR